MCLQGSGHGREDKKHYFYFSKGLLQVLKPWFITFAEQSQHDAMLINSHEGRLAMRSHRKLVLPASRISFWKQIKVVAYLEVLGHILTVLSLSWLN